RQWDVGSASLVDACACPTQCKESPPPPELLEAKATRFKREINIKWADECKETVNRYFVYRCKNGNKGGSCTIVSGELFPDVDHYQDTDLEEHTEYCYYVQGIYDTTTPGENMKESNLMCVTTGDEHCFTLKDTYGDLAEEFCGFAYGNTRSTCDEDNEIIEAPITDAQPFTDCSLADLDGDGEVDGPPEDMCIGPLADGKSRCIPSAVCDACSDAFGLFSFSRFHTTGLALKSSDFGKARGFSKDLSMAGLLSCNQLLGCFYDYSRISVDTFKPVTRNMTCYDYLSEAACDEDAKNLSICKWVNATEGYYHQVGFGVCRPTDIYQEDCGRCHDPLNGYFGKCGKETCGLYGHCYYDKDQLGRKYYALPYFDRDGDNMDYVCQHMFNISCEDYDTEADCVNSSSPYSSGAGLMSYGTVEVDVNGTLVFNKFNKNRGTNVQTGFSDDYFNYSKCQWKGEVRDGYGGVQEIIAPKCMRNADYSPPEFTVYEDSLDPTQNFNKSDYNKGADCPPLLPSNPRWIACRRDFRNPNTTIAYPDKVSATFVLEAFVDDDMSTYTISALPTTYSCIVPDGSAACYPNGTAESTVYANYVSWNNTYPSYETYNPDDGFQSGYYGLYYFSEDYAKNLEVVKKIDLFIDASPPKVDLVFSNESWELFEDIWRTNLSMDLNILEPDLPEETWDATCDITFFNEYHMELYPLLTVKDEFNRSWHRDYPYLEDGIYYLDYRCEDDVGNVAEDGIELIIDGDKSVTNPLPRGTLNYQDVELSVQTAKAADCKYLPSFDEIDAFNGTEPFGVAQYDSLMTQSFEFTGGTFHRQTLQLDNGWHRFYVKCRFPDELPEKRIVGSRADQIRFAVDVEPPATSMSTDTASYNDWYNGDVTVSLACQDQVMMDQVGLHWEYGCNDTKYCVGTDCGFFKTYTKPFTLDTSTNITFFSTDEGSNVEEVHTRQFLIDKVQPNLTLEVLDAGDFPAEFVKLDIPFKVRLSSDKPLISPAIGKPFVLFTSEPQKFNREITMMPTEDPAVWEGLLRLRNINDNRGFEGKGILTAVAADYHNVTGEVTIDFTVDTKPPTPPVLKPSIEDPDPENSEYIQEGYPLKFNNGTYFTNDRNLFLSGYTDELLDIVLAQSVEGLPKEFRYTQFETGEVFKDKAISGVSHKVKVEGDLTESVDNELFLGFGSAPQGSNPDLVGPRRTYRHYGEFYDLTSVIYIPGLLGADQYTEVTLYNPLEAPLSELAKNQQLFFYNRSVPSFYFGIPLDLEQYQHNLVMLFVYDIAGNIARYPPTPEVFDIYFDPDPPVLITSYPFPGTTSMTDLPIEMRILERTNASGIDESTINLTVNIDGADALMPAELSIESDDGSMTTFLIRVPSQHYADGEYKVSLYLEDWAGNPLNGNKTPYTWTFAVDSKAPPRPVFTLPDGNPGPYTESNTGQPTRWYTKEDTPPFTLEFMEDDPVTIVDIMFESSPTEGERAACTRKGDT
ncbi:MAG: chitobiase/beta-hexosaminidase C-terminal domain-containing protein, partial [Candidatus Nanoarchaeia archaeon]